MWFECQAARRPCRCSCIEARAFGQLSSVMECAPKNIARIEKQLCHNPNFPNERWEWDRRRDERATQGQRRPRDNTEQISGTYYSRKHADPDWCSSSSFTGCSRPNGCHSQVSYLPTTCPEAPQQSYIRTAATAKTCSANRGSNNHNHANSPCYPAPHPSQHNCSSLTG